MIQKSFSAGKILITDVDFGAVVPGDESFLSRCEQKLKWRPDQVVWMNQTHSNRVLFLDAVEDEVTVLDDTDGVMTAQRGVLLITKTADCVPVLLWNEKAQVIAALHCGWKGFMKGILESFADACRKYQFELSDFTAFLGPHLRAENFEVRQDFIDLLTEDKRLFLKKKNGNTHYDLTEGVIFTLKKLGVKELQDCGLNTYNSSDYFSYRAWCHLPETDRVTTYSTFANGIILHS